MNSAMDNLVGILAVLGIFAVVTIPSLDRAGARAACGPSAQGGRPLPPGGGAAAAASRLRHHHRDRPLLKAVAGDPGRIARAHRPGRGKGTVPPRPPCRRRTRRPAGGRCRCWWPPDRCRRPSRAPRAGGWCRPGRRGSSRRYARQYVWPVSAAPSSAFAVAQPWGTGWGTATRCRCRPRRLRSACRSPRGAGSGRRGRWSGCGSFDAWVASLRVGRATGGSGSLFARATAAGDRHVDRRRGGST